MSISKCLVFRPCTLSCRSPIKFHNFHFLVHSEAGTFVEGVWPRRKGRWGECQWREARSYFSGEQKSVVSFQNGKVSPLTMWVWKWGGEARSTRWLHPGFMSFSTAPASAFQKDATVGLIVFLGELSAFGPIWPSPISRSQEKLVFVTIEVGGGGGGGH